MIDDINTQLDKRNLVLLVDDGLISLRDVAEAPIVFICRCGVENDIEAEVCKNCGRPL